MLNFDPGLPERRPTLYVLMLDRSKEPGTDRYSAGGAWGLASLQTMVNNYRFIAKTEVVIGRSQPEPRSGEGCDQADHGRPVEAMNVFLATVLPTNGRGCHAAPKLTKPASKHLFFLCNSTTPSRKRTRCGIHWAMVEAVSTVMNTVEVSNQALVGGPGQKQGSSFGQGATFNNCTFHFG